MTAVISSTLLVFMHFSIVRLTQPAACLLSYIFMHPVFFRGGSCQVGGLCQMCWLSCIALLYHAGSSVNLTWPGSTIWTNTSTIWTDFDLALGRCCLHGKFVSSNNCGARLCVHLLLKLSCSFQLSSDMEVLVAVQCRLFRKSPCRKMPLSHHY
jgi:hypothetical protein